VERPIGGPGAGVAVGAGRPWGLDPSWHRYLRTFPAAVNGANLRNEILHGFVEDVDQTTAGLVLIALLYAALLHPVRKADAASASETAAPATSGEEKESDPPMA
jgi:hypothetical protein